MECTLQYNCEPENNDLFWYGHRMYDIPRVLPEDRIGLAIVYMSKTPSLACQGIAPSV